MKLDPIHDVIADVRAGKIIVIVDDADRENEGDLMIAAEKIDANAVNFMLQHGKGLICVSLTEKRLVELNLPFQVQHNTSPFGTNFAVSFDHRLHAQTGNTAQARADAIKAVASKHSRPEDFIKPGHVFPLGAVEGGVLKRRGQTEGSLDLSRLAGLEPAGVICEIMDESGEMLRGEKLQRYCEKHDFKITSVEEVVNYILENEVSLQRSDIVSLNFEQSFSHLLSDTEHLQKAKNLNAKVITYLDYKSHMQHYALMVGEKLSMIKIHYESTETDIFYDFLGLGSVFEQKLVEILENGSGALVYLREGADNKIAQYISKDLNSLSN